MPRKVSALTDKQLAEAKPGEWPRKIFDGGGLDFKISPAGQKTWRMKFFDTSGKESRMTFGNYPEVSLDLARSHRSVVRKILNSGLDPRKVFDHVRVGAPTSVIGQRLRLIYVDKAKLASCAALVGNDAVKRVESLVFPAFQRLVAEAVHAKSLHPALEQIRTDRNVEVVSVLYAMC